MVEGAVALTQAMQLGRVHLHGLLGDLIVVDDKGPGGEVDVDRTRLALLRARRYGLSDAGRADVVKDWHFFDSASQQHLFFVPSRGIHDRTGGTVSLGDTIDISALVFSSTNERPRPHPRLAT